MNTFRYSYYGFMRCTRGRRATSCPYKAGEKHPRQSVCFCQSTKQHVALRGKSNFIFNLCHHARTLTLRLHM